jgi:hypothetical protein
VTQPVATAWLSSHRLVFRGAVETAMREMLAVIDRQWSLFNAELEAELARTP